MEAKDTVMSEEQVWAVISKCEGTATEARHDVNKAQAEISFKAGEESITKLRQDEIEDFYNEGRQAGRKEVVEWMRKYGIIMETIDMHLEYQWQAQLKEWEVTLDK